MKTSENITNILKARVEAKKSLVKPKKDGINPHFKSKYVTHEALIKSIEEAMLPHGLDMFTQLLNNEDGTIGCRITLFHVSGEFIESDPFYLPCTQKTAQGYGSASTYVMRYAVSAFWSIAAQEDDDGNGAQEAPKKPLTKTFSKPQVNSPINEKPILIDDRFDIIRKIKETLQDRDVNEEDQLAWLKKKYYVEAFEKLHTNQLITLLAKLNDSKKGI